MHSDLFVHNEVTELYAIPIKSNIAEEQGGIGFISSEVTDTYAIRDLHTMRVTHKNVN